MTESALLSARGLCVSFAPAAKAPMVQALSDVNLTVEPGAIHAFLGPNGAGKSTTLRVLLGLLRPDSGTVRAFGALVTPQDSAWRQRVGFLRGEPADFPDLRCGALLDLMAALQGCAPVRRDAVLAALRVRSETLRRKLSDCSSGMRQAIFIAAAMQHDPELLLLDEPTNGLDPLVRADFLALLRATRDRGVGILLSSHVLQEVERVADTVTLLHEGRVRLCAPWQSLRLRWPRRVRRVNADGSESEELIPRADGAALRAIADAEPRDVLIEDAGLDEMFRGESA